MRYTTDTRRDHVGSGHGPVRTFDVFETALVRRVGVPPSVFLLLGAMPEVRNVTGLSPQAFAELRQWCELDRRRTEPTGEISLEEIYGVLVRDLGVDHGSVPVLMDAELSLEAKLLVPNRMLAAAVDDARESQGHVIWLSDTCLPSAWIATQLQRHGLLEPGDVVYASNEHAASKNRGDLYALVARDAGLEAAAFEHVGNDHAADVRRARQAGWGSRHVPEPNPNPHELTLEASSVASAGLSSQLAGASILTRLEAEARGADARRWNLAASVAGPAVSSFVLWLLIRAVELGLERIYFVARDGELLLQVARRLQICVPEAGNVELRYLYGSRQAWHLPAADLQPERIEGWLLERADRASVTDLLARLRIEPAHVADLLPVDELNAPLGDDGPRVVSALLEQPEFRRRLRLAAEDARRVLTGYLQQEGLLDAKPYACVELGWHGRALRSLQLVLNAAGHEGAARYQFFGLYPTTAPDGPPANAEAFFRDSRTGADVSWAHLYFLEAFCAGLEGRTVSVAERDGRYEPVLAEARNSAAVQWGLEAVYAGVEHFAGELSAGLLAAPEALTKANVLALRPAIDTILQTVWAAPTRQEAEVLGAIPLRNSLTHTGWDSLAPPLTWKDALAALRPNGARAGMGWYEGSAALTGPALRHVTAATWRARALQWRTRRRLKAALARRGDPSAGA
jgi:FMN phosphatase YigB (HAD superfamily)